LRRVLPFARIVLVKEPREKTVPPSAPSRAGEAVLADLAPLLAGSVPIDRALRIAASSQKSPKARAAAQALGEALAGGATFSRALALCGEDFGSAAVAAARAGEGSGHLAESLTRYVEYLSRRRALRRRIASSMAYPAVVAFVAVAALALLLGLVVPRIASLVASLGGTAPLPWPTRLLLSLSGFVRSGAMPFVAGILLAAGFVLFFPGREGSLAGRFFRRLPLVRGAAEEGALARATAALSALVASGVPLPEGLQMAGASAGDPRLAAMLEEAAREVARGLPFSATLRRYDWTGMALVAEVSALGEETGDLDKQLAWASGELESRSVAKSGALLALLEPALILAMALVVALVGAALFLPVVSFAERMGG
jgi:type II secretory pathway component PulF